MCHSLHYRWWWWSEHRWGQKCERSEKGQTESHPQLTSTEHKKLLARLIVDCLIRLTVTQPKRQQINRAEGFVSVLILFSLHVFVLKVQRQKFHWRFYSTTKEWNKKRESEKAKHKKTKSEETRESGSFFTSEAFSLVLRVVVFASRCLFIFEFCRASRSSSRLSSRRSSVPLFFACLRLL